MKKLLVSSLVSLSLLAFAVPSTVYASTNSLSTVTSPQSPAITPNPVTESNNAISPSSVSPGPTGSNSYWYSFQDVRPGAYTRTKVSDSFVIDSTESVAVKLIQYSAGSGGGYVAADYQLIPINADGSYSTSIYVPGTYSSTDDWITFSNVQPGDYVLKISDVGNANLDGNGIVYW